MLHWCEPWVNQGGISYRAELHLESCQAYTMELLQENSRQFQWVDYICRKGPTADVQLYSKCSSVWRCCKCGVKVDWKCVEFVIAGWCTRKWLRLDQTIGNLTCGDVEISPVVIRLGQAGLKKAGFVYLLGLLEGRREKGWCDLVCRYVFR